MNLSKQILQKIRILLDKPISTFTNRQLKLLILHELLQPDIIIQLLLYKNRADLILHLTQHHQLSFQQLQIIIQKLMNKLLKLQMQDIYNLMNYILSKRQYQLTERKVLGIQKWLQLGIRIPNEQLKSSIFKVLQHNINIFWKLGQKRIIQDLLPYYSKLFLKYNIYLEFFVMVLYQLIIKIKESKCLLDDNLRIELSNKMVSLLNYTKQKYIYHYQNCLIKCLTSLIQCQSQGQGIKIDFILIEECKKVVQLYLWNKTTREEARKFQNAVLLLQKRLQENNRGKMQLRYPNKEADYQKDKPLLIQNVIEKTNQYRLNQHLWNQKVQNNQISSSRDKDGRFLRKGNGLGGGKSFISRSPTGKKKIFESKIQEIIDNCFNQVQGRSEIKNLPKNHNKQIQNQIIPLTTKQQFANNNQKIIKRQQFQYKNQQNNLLEQDIQFIQISNLIDLAYSYKFAQ